MNRLYTYPLSTHAKETELDTIKTILQNNQYKLKHILTTPKKDNKNKNLQGNKNDNKKWSTFTYVGCKTKTFTKLFKDTNINIAYKTQNTIEHISRPKPSTTNYNIYKNDIYQLNCLECPKRYIAQTGRTFKTRYREHIQAFQNNRPDTGYSRHILDTGHAYGNMENTMSIIRKTRKGKFMNSLEKHHIFLANKQEIHMNEFHIDIDNNYPFSKQYIKNLKNTHIDSSTVTSPLL
jgi:hypothetical protein